MLYELINKSLEEFGQPQVSGPPTNPKSIVPPVPYINAVQQPPISYAPASPQHRGKTVKPIQKVCGLLICLVTLCSYQVVSSETASRRSADAG